MMVTSVRIDGCADHVNKKTGLIESVPQPTLSCQSIYTQAKKCPTVLPYEITHLSYKQKFTKIFVKCVIFIQHFLLMLQIFIIFPIFVVVLGHEIPHSPNLELLLVMLVVYQSNCKSFGSHKYCLAISNESK